MKSTNNPQGIDIKRFLPIIVLVVLGAIVLLLTRSGSSDNDNDIEATATQRVNIEATATQRVNIEATATQRVAMQQVNQDNAADAGIVFGNVVVSESVDRDGCAVNTTSSFNSDTSQFYVVAEESTIPANTEVFVRLYRDGQPVEDLPPITSADSFENTCINFVFESTSTFESGNYEAEFIVNGNPMNSVQFEIN